MRSCVFGAVGCLVVLVGLSGCRRGGGGPGGCLCVEDGYCCPTCAHGVDPDCDGIPDCSADGYCEPACGGTDPDCEEEPDCGPDSWCNPACPEGADPDCEEPDCGYDSWCNPACPSGTDPDCEEPDCGYDSWCNPACPSGADPDCEVAPPDCGYDSWCNPACPAGTDPDCATGCPPPTGGDCEIIPQRCCEAGEMCTIGYVGTTVMTGCLPSGTVPVGGSCATADCAAGGVCMDFGDGTYQCLRVCRLYGSDCTGDDECLSLGHSVYGVCYGASE